MKVFNLLLLWCLGLVTHVLANNEAAPYELLHYYYVYKLEWDTGIDKTIAPGCATEYGHMCYFDEFAKYLMDDNWRDAYRPSAADHTKTPGMAAVSKLSSNIPRSARYKLNLLLPHINADAKSFPLVFEAVLHAANNAIAQDNVNKDDLEQAVEMAQEIKEARTPAVFEIQEAALKARVGEEAFEFVQVTASGFKWPETLAAIDSAIEDGDLTAEKGATMKESIRLFSLTYEHDILAGEVSDHNHLNIVKSLATSITSLTRGIEERFPESGGVSSSGPSSECESEFSYSSTSSSSDSD
ncbi:hypothetical protein PEX1_099700 [Penicillium expansum]|uniref:Uncharacterized protein n=1 Tax=Penicillium expansum TaxID=27334 RepID=A0A0A2KR79_PENEN|nr:hypothetical protein PEX2_092040 [Penicillium expansum]KGO58849.1 hypothetical protein PEX2_092040 [Penicillium expansum]KGO69458.1 hypothetical protein PEX1_099700 [Penicillium expansum]